MKQRVRALTDELEKVKKESGGNSNTQQQLSQDPHATSNGQQKRKAFDILSSTSPEGELPKSQEQLLLSEVEFFDLLIIFLSSLYS